MMIEFTTSSGQSVTFRLAPGVTTEDGTGAAIPSAIQDLDMFDRYALALLVEAALTDKAAAAPGGEGD